MMVVVPTSTHVRLHFERSTLDDVSYVLTLIGIVLLIFFRIHGDVRYRSESPFDPAPAALVPAVVGPAPDVAAAGEPPGDPSDDWPWLARPPDDPPPFAGATDPTTPVGRRPDELGLDAPASWSARRTVRRRTSGGRRGSARRSRLPDPPIPTARPRQIRGRTTGFPGRRPRAGIGSDADVLHRSAGARHDRQGLRRPRHRARSVQRRGRPRARRRLRPLRRRAAGAGRPRHARLRPRAGRGVRRRRHRAGRRRRRPRPGVDRPRVLRRRHVRRARGDVHRVAQPGAVQRREVLPRRRPPRRPGHRARQIKAVAADVLAGHGPAARGRTPAVAASATCSRPSPTTSCRSSTSPRSARCASSPTRPTAWAASSCRPCSSGSRRSRSR